MRPSSKSFVVYTCRLFFKLTAGGPATGVLFGIAMTLWLRKMFNKPLAEITLTIAAAYATYIVADQLFEVSAVLATVFLGTSQSLLNLAEDLWIQKDTVEATPNITCHSSSEVCQVTMLDSP